MPWADHPILTTSIFITGRVYACGGKKQGLVTSEYTYSSPPSSLSPPPLILCPYYPTDIQSTKWHRIHHHLSSSFIYLHSCHRPRNFEENEIGKSGHPKTELSLLHDTFTLCLYLRLSWKHQEQQKRGQKS